MLIYKITNTINNKVYIGQTTRALQKRINEHKNNMLNNKKSELYDDMRLYGFDKFTFDIIETTNTIRDLNELESYYINKYKSNVYGYNKTSGGKYEIMQTEHVREKHNKSMRNENIRLKISKSLKEYRQLNNFSSIHRQNLSNAMIGNHNFGTGDTRSIECYCIDENGLKHDFHNKDEAGKWWHRNYKPFGPKYNYATFRRKITDCINYGKCEFGRLPNKIVVDNIKWYLK